MDAGACGVMVAPLTGLKTEAQIVSLLRRSGGGVRRKYSGRVPGLSAVDAGRHLRAKLPQDRRRPSQRGDVQARGLPRLEEALANAQSLRWRRATIHQHPGRQWRAVRAAGTASRRRRHHDRLRLSRDAGFRVRAVRRLGAATRPKTCSMSICRWCATSSNQASALRCARRCCAGAALSVQLRSRSPGPKLDATDIIELDRLLARLETRLSEGVVAGCAVA